MNRGQPRAERQGRLPAVVLLSQTEWGLGWVLAHDLAIHFSARGHPVVFLDPFPKRFPRAGEWRRLLGRLLGAPRLARFSGHALPPGTAFLTPLTLPDSRRLFTWINRRLLLPRLRKRVLAACCRSPERWVFVFLPFATPVLFAGMLAPSRLVYARRDGYEDDHGLRGLRFLEEQLLRRADLVVASGRKLAERSRAAAGRVRDIPGLVDFAAFYRPISDLPPPAEPLCCYVGHVDRRVDLDILAAAAQRFRLRVIGRVSVPWPEAIAAERAGAVPHERVAGLLAECDVMLIPYRLGGFFDSIFPYKIFEAFAQGKPVVATPLPALEPLASIVYLAATPGEYVVQISRAAAEGLEVKQRRQELARRHDRGPVLDALRRELLAGGAGVRP